jgi:ribosome-interacting GTPase 1
MPTNLPPEYFEAERRFRNAKTIQEKIDSLEDLLSTIPKHKGTDKLRADWRRRLSKLKTESYAKAKKGKHESVYHIEREGAGRVLVVGPTNTGKSSLVATLTHASPKISESPFTTWVPTPGMMPIEDVQVQLIDTPPLNKEHIEPDLMDLIKSTDLILLVVDLIADPIQQLQDGLDILAEHHISFNSENEIEPSQHKIIIPLVTAVNKYDDEKSDEDFQIFCDLIAEKSYLVPVSAKTNRNLDQLKKLIFNRLNIMRVYTKKPGEEPDLGTPFVLKKESIIAEFAEKVHKDFAKNLKTARVWGSGTFDGQMVSKDHVLQDGDVVELHL